MKLAWSGGSTTDSSTEVLAQRCYHESTYQSAADGNLRSQSSTNGTHGWGTVYATYFHDSLDRIMSAFYDEGLEVGGVATRPERQHQLLYAKWEYGNVLVCGRGAGEPADPRNLPRPVFTIVPACRIRCLGLT